MSSGNSAHKTLASRLTLWNASIYIAFFGSAFLLFYLSINTILHNDLDEDLEEDVAEFRMLLESDGFAAVKLEIEREFFSDDPEDSFFRIMDSKGTTLFTSDLSDWDKARDSPQLPEKLAQDNETVFGTITAPDDDYNARVVYGWIGPDMILQTGESMEDIQDLMSLLSTIFIITFAIVVLFASAVGWFLARRAMHGVEEVSSAAVDVANGTLDRRVNVKTEGAEIERLASTFNAMLDRIHTLMSGMREMTDNVAHDLRSPLARIRANAEMALSSATTVEEYRDSAADTLEECDRLMHMINTTLDVAEAEAGAASLSMDTVDISRVAEDACELFTPIAEDKGIFLSASIEPGCRIQGNLQLLQRMLANLLDNAFKYSERDSSVNIGVNTSGENILVSVRDEGMGISKQDLKKIFDRFFRCDESRSKTGCGLGLSLVRAVAIAHGGNIAVSSTPGNGSEFRIILPT
ncbi:MAG: HAMP domain-containing sensor histidine kinase [Pseudomonadota bacterium]